jgi:hypothetical protein
MAVCAIGGVDDGTLRVCCSTHQHVLCGHHYAVTHFVCTAADYDGPACTAPSAPITAPSGDRQCADAPDQSAPASRQTPGEGVPGLPLASNGGSYVPPKDPAGDGLVIPHIELTCDQCNRPASNSQSAVCTDSLGAFAFCGDACLATWVRARLIECRRDVA